MVTAQVIEVLDLVDTDNPVFTREGLLDAVEDRAAVIGKADTTDAILSLSRGEEIVVVMIRHLVPVK